MKLSCILKRVYVLCLTFLFLSACNNNEAHSSTYDSNKLSLVSKSVLDFYKKTLDLYYADVEPTGDPEYSIAYLYECYKKTPLVFEEKYRHSGREISLAGEDHCICYYVSKAFIEDIVYPFGLESSVIMDGLPGYFYLVDGYNKSVDCNLYQYSVSVNETSIPKYIGDYYLIDVVRFYQSSSEKDIKFVDFVGTKLEEQYRIINQERRNDTLKYRYGFNGEIDHHNGFIWLGYNLPSGPWISNVLANSSLQIVKENENDVVKETIVYHQPNIDSDSGYYDELNECVLSKDLIEKSYYDVRPHYLIAFDYFKLLRLFFR